MGGLGFLLPQLQGSKRENQRRTRGITFYDLIFVNHIGSFSPQLLQACTDSRRLHRHYLSMGVSVSDYRMAILKNITIHSPLLILSYCTYLLHLETFVLSLFCQLCPVKEPQSRALLHSFITNTNFKKLPKNRKPQERLLQKY